MSMCELGLEHISLFARIITWGLGSAKCAIIVLATFEILHSFTLFNQNPRINILLMIQTGSSIH